jgi:CubicO group peptidase (beta-lactamase class C family)
MQAAAKMGFNGNVLVAKSGKPVYKKSFGYADLDSKEPLSEKSVFTIASVSKQFTAMSILLLKEQHKLTLTDTLRQFFPQLPYHNITIQQMLTHTSGLPDYFNLMIGVWDHHKVATNNDLINVLVAEHPPVFFKPGTHYRYCNTGYALLACIVEKVTGQSFHDFMAENIFKPLHMRSSRIYVAENGVKEKIPGYAYGFSYSDSLKKFVAPARIRAYELVDFVSGIAGDGDVASTTGDLLKWDRALKKHKLLSEADQEDMLSPHVLYDTLSKIYYGYGHAMGLNELGNYISHEGIWPGYRACLTRYLDQDVTVIVLSNNESSATGISRALSFIEFGKEVVPPYQHKEITIDSASLTLYAGVYYSPAPVQLVIRNGKLYRHREGTDDIELKPESSTKFFYADSSDRQIEFILDVRGKVEKTWLISNGIKSPLTKR